jgi:hypothetical protein
MSGYIGNIPVPQATQTRDNFTATAGQTTFSTSGYTPSYLDVYLNGIHLDPSDYTATNGTDVVLASGASAGDVVTVVAYTTFEVGSYGGDLDVNGTITFDGGTTSGDLSFGDNDQAIFGASNDLQIYHNGNQSWINEAGTGNLNIQSNGAGVYIKNGDSRNIATFGSNTATLFYDNGTTNSQKLATTSTGIDVTGTVTADGLTVDGNAVIQASTGDVSLTLQANENSSSSEPAFNLKGYNTSSNPRINFGDNVGYYGRIEYENQDDSMRFWTNTAERMRIDSSGNLLVGKSAIDTDNVGIEARGSIGFFAATANNLNPAAFERRSSDGDIVLFRKDGNTVGSIGKYTGSSRIYIGSGDTGLVFGHDVGTGDAIFPMNPSTNNPRDNAIDLGVSSARFDDIYATNGSIQTSDRNEKQDIAELSEAEQRVAVACKGLLRKFRWKDAVAEKGDDARIHFGIIAQDLQDAFAAEGLDAGRYAMFISSTWWETQTEVPAVEAVEAQDAVYDDEGNLVSEAVEAVEAKEAYIRTDTYETAEEAPEGATERTRLGVRYPELLAFIIAAI